MDRRAALAALGAGTALLAGCQGALSTADSPTRTSNPEPHPDRRIEIMDTASAPSNTEITATVEHAQITADSTARLAVEWTNTGDTRTTSVSAGGHCHFFNRTKGQSDPAGAWLYRTEDTPTERIENRWTPDIEGRRTYSAIGCGSQAFEADASIRTTYEVWDDHTTAAYLPTGTYRFKTTLSFGSARDDSEPESVEWWLDLAVRDAED